MAAECCVPYLRRRGDGERLRLSLSLSLSRSLSRSRSLSLSLQRNVRHGCQLRRNRPMGVCHKNLSFCNADTGLIRTLDRVHC
jgi:hypothetical protein